MSKKVLIVNANYYLDISSGLLKSALEILTKKNRVKIINVPGVFEIPVTISKNLKKFDGFIALGCVIKGETDHYHYISQAVTNGIMSVTLEETKTNTHIIFGVLTCQNKELAYVRSGDDNRNKGYEAGLAAIHQINN